MANDVGVSLREFEELNEFAGTSSVSESGDTCSKRMGRVLMRKDVQHCERREVNNYGDVNMTDQLLFHRREDCRSEDCEAHTAPASKWRDIYWSRFSDSTCTDEDVAMSGIDANTDYDDDEGMTALDGYLKMAKDADEGVKRSSSIMNIDAIVDKTVLGTAKVARRIRPAKLCMKSSVETVEAAVGPMRERVWS